MKIIMTRQSKIRYRNLNIVRSEIIHPTASTLDMNNVNNAYIESLKDNNCTDIKTNYKPCLKHLIKDNISIAEFIKPIQKNGPEKICTKSKKIILKIQPSNAKLTNMVKFSKLPCSSEKK